MVNGDWSVDDPVEVTTVFVILVNLCVNPTSMHFWLTLFSHVYVSYEGKKL